MTKATGMNFKPSGGNAEGTPALKLDAIGLVRLFVCIQSTVKRDSLSDQILALAAESSASCSNVTAQSE